MPEIRHIVFDIGNVLIRWDPEVVYRRLIPDAAERARFFEDVAIHDWNLEQDRGRSWADAEAAVIAKFPHYETNIRAWRRYWHDMVPGPIEETAAILEQLLDDGLDVTALTNFADDTFDEAVKRFPYLARFRGVTVSARVKLIKPDLAIYRHHAESHSLDPASILFFDDMPANIAAAREAGWNAERFIDPPTMRADLKRYGIKGFA